MTKHQIINQTVEIIEKSPRGSNTTSLNLEIKYVYETLLELYKEAGILEG